MPSNHRTRTLRHQQIRKTVPTQLSQAAREGPPKGGLKPEDPQIGQPGGKVTTTKKQKQILRRETLKQRLGIAASPSYSSKSHKKRLKRKAKDQLCTDLKTVEQAIASVETGDFDTHDNVRQGQIGEGKQSSLTSKQRQRAFRLESLRHKLVLQTPEFTSNPFQTVRTHAQNTLVKRQLKKEIVYVN